MAGQHLAPPSVPGDRTGGAARPGQGAAGVTGQGAAAAGWDQLRSARRDDARAAAVREVLQGVLAGLVAQTGREQLEVLDAGGGTGGFAVPLAGLGHRVTVVDPSPDSLAAAQRRAAEMTVPLRAIQGDAADLVRLAGEGSADLVLCHSVLEYVDSPAATMTAIAAALRPGGAVSVLAASAVAAVIHRALAGRITDAARLLAAIGTTQAPRHGQAPSRWFTLAEVTGLIEDAGLRPGAAHGVGVFTDLVPSAAANASPAAAQALRDLELAAAAHPAFHDFAARFHVLGYR